MAVASSLEDLFMMTRKNCTHSDITRARVNIFNINGSIAKVTVCTDTGSSISIAHAELLHDMVTEKSGPIGGFAGEGELTRRGYMIIPHKSKPGSTVCPAYVDEGNLSSGVDALVGKRQNGMIGTDTWRLSNIPATNMVPGMPYARGVVDSYAPTHATVTNDTTEHKGRMAEHVWLGGNFDTGFCSVQYGSPTQEPEKNGFACLQSVF
jgi:hypothetical protein